MCGRFLMDEPALVSSKKIARIPDWIQQEIHFGDIYPSMPSLVLVDHDGQLEGRLEVFGAFQEKMNKRIINARSETVQEKWMFRHAFHHDRCVVPCGRFYEWSPEREKVSFFLQDQTMYLAAVSLEDSFVILTRPANASVDDVHHRMPVIFNADQAVRWVTDEQAACQLLNQPGPQLENDRPQAITLF